MSITSDRYWRFTELVLTHKRPICPISALLEKFNPQNINQMPAAKFYARLDLEQICLILDEHELVANARSIFTGVQKMR